MSRNPSNTPHQPAFAASLDVDDRFNPAFFEFDQFGLDIAQMEAEMERFQPSTSGFVYPPGMGDSSSSGPAFSLPQVSQIAPNSQLAQTSQQADSLAGPVPKKRGRPAGRGQARGSGRGKRATATQRDSSSVPTVLDSNTLFQQGQDTVDLHRRALTTNKAYAGHIRVVKDWIKNYQASRTENDPDLSDVFDVLSIRSAQMVFLFWTSRQDQVGFRSIEGSRSALKAYFAGQFPNQCHVSAISQICIKSVGR
jgi:hypothetical protein